MRTRLTTRWFFGIVVAAGVLCALQFAVLIAVEVHEIITGSGSGLHHELSEIAGLLAAGAVVFVIMLGFFWFISRRMVRPIRKIAQTATLISSGSLDRRIEGVFVDDEIGALVSALNKAWDRYDIVLAKLRRFTSNAAHQLRTPLASIRVEGEVCLKRQRTEQEYRDAMGSILEAAAELSRTLERLLLIAKLESREVQRHFASFDLAALLEETTQEFRPASDAKGLVLTVRAQGPLTVKGDKTLLRQALANLLDNAIRFTPDHGSIDVAAKREEDSVVLTVSDTGPGVTEALQPYLFERFSHAPRVGDHGAGLGLAIVDEIARLHEGKAELVNAKSRGTCIRLVLPL